MEPIADSVKGQPIGGHKLNGNIHETLSVTYRRARASLVLVKVVLHLALENTIKFDVFDVNRIILA